MKKELLKIGYNSKIALQENLSEKVKNKVLNDYFLLIKKNKTKIIISNKKDINFAGIDIIGQKLTEINITSPTCAREIFEQSGMNPIEDYFKKL